MRHLLDSLPNQMSNLTAPITSENPSNEVSHILIITCVVVVNVLAILTIYFLFFLWNRIREPVSDEAFDNSGFNNSTPCSSPRASGVKEKDLSLIPEFVHEGTNVEEKKECAVCINEFVNGQIGRVLPACGHKFHMQCIDTWFKKHITCPVCRTDVKGDKIEEERRECMLDV